MHDIFIRFFGWLLGLENPQSVDFTFAAPWARRGPGWLVLGCAVLLLVSIVFYVYYQRVRHSGSRLLLTVLRAGALCLLLFLLAEPVLRFTETTTKLPMLWFVFDGTDSMNIADDLPTDERSDVANAVGIDDRAVGPVVKPGGDGAEDSGEAKPDAPRSRIDYVKALVAKKNDNLLQKLRSKYRIQAFLYDSAQGVRSLELTEAGKPGVDGPYLAGKLTTDGKVTAIGAALSDLAKRNATTNLGGVVLFSDFDENVHSTPAVQAARQLGAPVYTVGIGATTALDVAVEVMAEPFAHKDERTSVTVVLKHQGLEGQEVHVTLVAEQLAGLGEGSGTRYPIGDKKVTLTGAATTVEIPYTPDKAGRFWLVADVDPVPGEVVGENNHARREIIVLDDFLRLLYVEHEPTWEWRFIKEVFHRDRLVGMKGFRTYLYSSDPRVRRINELFLPSMTSARSEFFNHDVIFIGDCPASSLSPRFCEMAKEFVGDFGGGLVFVCGPRFGPEQLTETPLSDLLPVKPDVGVKVDDRQPFQLKLTPMAAEYKFMQLGSEDKPGEAQRAWDNMGPLPWYQPVKRKHPQAVVLAEHPKNTCVDGKEKQPLIAVRPYGRGEVVYLGFNETWRLRRRFGERYYRQFWGQMIERLALNHALGGEKRFVVRTDRRNYQVDDTATITVEAFNANFEPLSENDLVNQKLQGELLMPVEGSEARSSQTLNLAQLRKGVFEARVPLYAKGEYRVRVTDPITSKPVEWTFQAIGTPVERRTAVRNVSLQRSLADETGGKSYDLRSVASLADDVRVAPKKETNIETRALASTWLCFGLVAGMLLCEWMVRKWVNLP
jgi:hypothetical protein